MRPVLARPHSLFRPFLGVLLVEGEIGGLSARLLQVTLDVRSLVEQDADRLLVGLTMSVTWSTRSLAVCVVQVDLIGAVLGVNPHFCYALPLIEDAEHHLEPPLADKHVQALDGLQGLLRMIDTMLASLPVDQLLDGAELCFSHSGHLLLCGGLQGAVTLAHALPASDALASASA